MKKITLLLAFLTYSFGSAQTIPVDFESGVTVGGNFIVDNVTSLTIVADPAAGGTNGQVAQIVTNAAAMPWQNVQLTLTANYLDLSNATGSKIVTMSVYSTTAVDYLFKVEDPLNGGGATQTAAQHNGSGWQTLTFDFNLPAQNGPVPNDEYKKLVLFPLFNKTLNDFNPASVTTTYIDNINGDVGTALNPPVALTLIEDFQAGVTIGENFINDGLTSLDLVADPAAGGANAQTARIVTNAASAPWQNAQFILTANYLDLTGTNKTVSLDVYSNTPIDYLLKVEDPLNGGAATQTAESHTGSGWETLVFNFNVTAQGGPAPNDEYKKIVFFPLFNKTLNDFNPAAVTTTYIDNLSGALGTAIAAPDELTLIEDFQAGVTIGENFINDGLISLDLVSDPAAGGVNAQTARIVTNAGSAPWQNAQLIMTANYVDLTGNNKTVSLDVYSTTPIDYLLKVEDPLNGGAATQASESHTGSGWETLTFDFNTPAQGGPAPNDEYKKIVFFPLFNKALNDFNPAAETTSYIDNFRGVIGTAIEDFGPGICITTSNQASEGSFSVGYKVTYETLANGTDVQITYELLDTDKIGLVAFLQQENPFNESNLDFVSGQTWTTTITGLTPGETISYRCKFAFAGGLANTLYIPYVVGSDCSETNDVTAPFDFTASVGTITATSIELNLNASDLSGMVVYTITFNGMTLTYSADEGSEFSAVIGALDPNTEYTFEISASDLAGNVASNNPIILVATTIESTNTPCAGLDFEASEGTFEVGYNYSFETVGTDVIITFELLDNKDGVVAFLFRETPFQETPMTLVAGTSKTFTSTITGQTVDETISYACKFAFAGGLAVTKYFQYVVGDDCALSNNNFDAASFAVYPNPTQNNWTISTTDSQIKAVQVYDISGKNVLTVSNQSNEIMIDAAPLNKGIYLAQIQTENGVQTIKLVKN
uniref:T9SS type A sorting domain-containing protein n=3 Tax=Flavobacterium sp. TaxID=239 RepID=UPI00404A9BD7